MRHRRKSTGVNIFESFSDVALLMLATFIFLLVTILITSRMAQEYQLPKLKEEVARLRSELQASSREKARLTQELGDMAGMATETQIQRVLRVANLDQGKGRKDFEIFIQGLKDIPGRDLHLIVDATGSMHGVSTFLIPILRVIVVRSGKHLDAITWFSDGKAETYTGSMGEMFDQLMNGAPFIGANETIGDALHKAAAQARTPGAYLLLGDEPSDDRIFYLDVPAPVFTLPIGRKNPSTLWEYQTLADRTGGKMLHLDFR
ncbi:MAG TPA: hypothetical protein ENK48_02790 [Gammaproteobacteria bacterium]|nr:hypothetical protein [Gammaproteobacteria bacterium]